MERLQNAVLILFVGFALIECSQPAQQEAAIRKDSLGMRDTGNAVMIQNKIETTNDSPIDTLPTWLKKVYNRDTTYTLSDGHVYDEIHERIEQFTVINDSVTYCIVHVGSYTCGKKFIATQLNKKEIQRMDVDEECDDDYSRAWYDWTIYKFQTSTVFEITNFIVSVKDSLIAADGWIKNGTREDLETRKDSTKKKFRIDKLGDIVQIK